MKLRGIFFAYFTPSGREIGKSFLQKRVFEYASVLVSR
jgi:hypothetical protein